MKHPDYDYDEIADNIFFPIYDRIAEQIIDATDVRSGKMLDIGCGGGHLGFAVMEKTELEGYFADIKKRSGRDSHDTRKGAGHAGKSAFLCSGCAGP